MRRYLHFLAGLLVGFALGVLVAGWVRERPPGPFDGETALRETPSEAIVVNPDATAAPAALAGTPSPAAAADPRPPDVPRLRGEVASARADESWPRLLRALDALGMADTPEADRALVDVLGDASVVFLEPLHEDYRAWLSGTDIEGVADAVRRRIAADAATYDIPESRAARPWTVLLAEHGSLEDIVWLEGLLTERESFARVLKAFLDTDRPEAVALARQIVRDRYEPAGARVLGSGTLDVRAAFFALARADPTTALAALEEETDRWHVKPACLHPYLALPLYAQTLPPERVAHGVARMLSLFEQWPQEFVLPLLQVVSVFEERGLDASGLAPVSRWPAAYVLEMAGRGGPTQGDDFAWRQALRLLLQTSDRLASEASLEALEAALPFCDGEREQERVRRRMHAIRAQLQWVAEER